MKEGAQDLALIALQFFSAPKAAQLKVLQESRPESFAFFAAGDDGSNYSYGVACVFITHAGHLYDKCASEAQTMRLADFHDELSALMTADGDAWACLAIDESVRWSRLRKYAASALEGFGASIPARLPVLPIMKLVNLTEFRASEDAKRLLE